MEGVTIQPGGQGRLLVTFPYSEARVEQIKSGEKHTQMGCFPPVRVVKCKFGVMPLQSIVAG